MNFAQAAAEVLRRHGEGRPLHYRRITQLAVSAGLITPGGLTPEASVNAALTTTIARERDAGEEPTFIAYGRGLYGLAGQRVVTQIEEAIRRNNRDVRERLHAELRELDGRAFEELIGRLLNELGFVDVEVTAYSRDGGIDVRATLAVGGITNVVTAIQVKRWTTKKVSGSTVRELRGGLTPHERGLIITVGGFTPDAVARAAESDKVPIALVDGERLVELLVDNGIGVIRSEARILQLDPGALLGPGDDDAELPDEELAEIVGVPARKTRTKPRPRTRLSRHPSGKNLSLWPLPGGRGQFVTTAFFILGWVSESEPTLDEFIDWMLASFERVNSRKTAKGYIEMLRLSGLVEPRGDRLVLSAAGAACLASEDPGDLYLTMNENIAGLADTYEFVARTPARVADVTTFLNDLLGTEWDSDAQAGWRLGWLESFGKVRREADLFVAEHADVARRT